jgi:predicted DNA-binding protein (UPF0251 family)
MPKRKKVTALLRDLKARHPVARRSELGAPLADVAEHLIEDLASESEQQRRRFTVLRRSDILGQSHAEIARDVGLSRSQFYRDLSEARERFAAALERTFSVRAATPGLLQPGVATRRITIEGLRNAGQHDQARAVATTCLRVTGPLEAAEVLCLRAELEMESGDFAAAQLTTAQARTLLPQIAEKRPRHLLALACDLADFESAHCSGTPADPALRDSCLTDLRCNYAAGDRAYASLLVKALIGEASLLFSRGEEFRALALIEEASALVRREPSVDTRLAIDVQVRVSGLHALRPDALSTALEEAAQIIDAGMRWRDAHTLRLGLQSMSAHLLTLGRLDEAREYALQARSLIDLFGSALDGAIVLSNLARIDVHRRDGAGALRWVALARDVGCDAFPITQAIAISEAEALALIDQSARAIDTARAAVGRVRDWPRLHARAKLAEAIALSTLASSREAQWCSSEAVELSRVAGGPLVELRALDLNVKLTGDAASRRALRDLQAALSI